MDKEKEEIEELSKKLRAYAYDLQLNNNEDCCRVAEFIVETLNYRKMEEVTLKLDLGDRTPEEIKRITEQLSKAMSKTPPVVSLSESLSESEICKQAVKEFAEKYKEIMYKKMGKHNNLLGKEFVQRIMRETTQELLKEYQYAQ